MSSACRNFLDDPSLAHHHRPHPGARTDHSARRRAIKALERGGTFRDAGPAQYLLLADQPPRGSVRAIPMCCGRAASSIISTPMAKRSACRRCRSSGTAASIGEGLKVPVLGADTSAGPRRTRKARNFCNRQTRSEARMTRIQDVYPDDRVSLREVGLRDGLQLVKKLSLDSRKAALDPRRIRRRRAAFRGRLVPARQDFSAIRRRPRYRRDHRRDCRARMAWRWR